MRYWQTATIPFCKSKDIVLKLSAFFSVIMKSQIMYQDKFSHWDESIYANELHWESTKWK